MNIREFSFNSIIAAVGTLFSVWLGAWDAILRALVLFMILDYLTGLLGAIKSKSVNSEVMFWGGVRKGIILAVVAVAVMLDEMVGNTEPIFRTLSIYFYLAREGVSVTENLGILGIPLPPAVTKVLAQLQEKGEAK